MAKHQLASDGYYDTHPWCAYCKKDESKWIPDEECPVLTRMESRYACARTENRDSLRKELAHRQLTDIELDVLIDLRESLSIPLPASQEFSHAVVQVFNRETADEKARIEHNRQKLEAITNFRNAHHEWGKPDWMEKVQQPDGSTRLLSDIINEMENNIQPPSVPKKAIGWDCDSRCSKCEERKCLKRGDSTLSSPL